jgi:hypothetical protein
MTLPRFRLRILMILVAATAVLFAVANTYRRKNRLSAEYQAKAAEWGMRGMVASMNMARAETALKNGRSPDQNGIRLVERYKRQLDYCRTMALKYRYAATIPWTSVALDLPEPE